MPAFDLIAFDLDGTVIGDYVTRRMSDRVRDAFVAAHGAGVQTTVVSGRPIGMLDDQFDDQPWLDWRITVNGACVDRGVDEDILVRRPMSHAMALDVIDSLKDLRAAWNAFSPGGPVFELRNFTYMAGRKATSDRPHLPKTPSQIRRAIPNVRHVRSVRRYLASHRADVDKLGCSFPTPETSVEAEDRLTSRGDLEVARMGPAELELTLAGVTKGSALGILCSRIGMDESRVVAFGDSGNDLSMTGRDCTFVAMGNGTDQIKAAADDVCPSVADDGVACWLERYL
ncbi:MAG: Cof-type HAD-IIB family hydrolase [Atopobiaceae bacterium]|nr:Cof-type HAD-IIB family hydrolase [Atopobiaceae bacterium]MCI2172816.1 Cof-type HAD-IIB family hydrolase [Atopobiaceae bacterium]MCI2207123.1 Cof-type HAD-IIB family hydrolase [Atopobiaceae bacterium]